MKPALVLAIASCLAAIASTAAGEFFAVVRRTLIPCHLTKDPFESSYCVADRAKAERYLSGAHIRPAVQGFENALRMRSIGILFFLGLVLFGGAGLAQARPSLYSASVRDVPAENGKRLAMSFQEEERSRDDSLVSVTFISGGSVSSSMFVLRNMCGLARDRGEELFQCRQVSPGRFSVSFLKPPAKSTIGTGDLENLVLALGDCALLGF
jgi:hypothetical protein